MRYVTYVGCIFFVLLLVAGVSQLLDFSDSGASVRDNYHEVLSAWQGHVRESFGAAASSSRIKVMAELYDPSDEEQTVDLAPTKVTLKESDGLLTDFPTAFGELEPLSFTGQATLPNTDDWNGTLTIVVDGMAVPIPRVWWLNVEGIRGSPDKQIQYTLESICIRVATDPLGHWELQADAPAAFVRPSNIFGEVLSDPFPVGCTERNLAYQGTAGEQTQKLHLWGAGVYDQRSVIRANSHKYPETIPIRVMSAEDPQISAFLLTRGDLEFPAKFWAGKIEALAFLAIALLCCSWAPIRMFAKTDSESSVGSSNASPREPLLEMEPQ